MTTQIEPCDFAEIIREETPQAVRVADYLALHSLSRIIDVGCGPGIYVTAMRDVGLDAYGIDNDDRLPDKPWFQRVDLAGFPPTNMGDPFDVALSLEVGEHLPETMADRYVRALENTGAKIIYFSAARPGQGGHGHINCQPKAYWVERFHRAGFWLDPDATDRWLSFMRSGYHMGWLTQNGLVLKRA